MTTREARHPAEERLLDAALQQVYESSVRELDAMPQPRPSARWFQAAVLLFGLAILGAVLWQSHETGPLPASDEASVQDPESYGAAVSARGREQIEALPDDTTNLTCGVLTAGDLKLLERFKSLRRLQISAMDLRIGLLRTKAKHESWRKPSLAVLEPLAELPVLESLTLPLRVDLTAEHLAPLRDCPKLRELFVMGERIPLNDAFIDALKRLPNLRSLRLDVVRVDAKIIVRLRELKLEALEISRAPGFDAEAFAELCEMKSLRRLEFAGLGRPSLRDRQTQLWMPSAENLGRLTELTELRHLAVRGCALGVDELRALPDRLFSLDVQRTELKPAEFRELRRFGLLRRLKVGTARYNITFTPRDSDDDLLEAADAIAQALDVGGLRLLKFELLGEVSDALLRELARQPDLEDLTINSLGLPSMEELASARSLRKLTLYERRRPSTLELDGLRALAACDSLREILIGGTTELTNEAVASVLDKRVDVRVDRFEK